METKVYCPYCGNTMNSKDEQCTSCKEFFVEPYVEGLKEPSIIKFIIFEILTLGLYSLIWVTFNNSAIRKIAKAQDYRKFITCYLLLFFSILGLWFVNIPLFAISKKVVSLFLSYRMLRIFEKYSMKKYNASIFHNEYGWFFFEIAYVVYFLEMFSERVNMPTKKHFINLKNGVVYSSIALCTLIIGSFLVLLLAYLNLKV